MNIICPQITFIYCIIIFPNCPIQIWEAIPINFHFLWFSLGLDYHDKNFCKGIISLLEKWSHKNSVVYILFHCKFQVSYL